MGRAHRAGEVSATRGRGGRYLDSSRDLVLREAALALLAEVGYDRLTMDAVAARARAAKTTIYRRWRDKAELVVDSLNSLKGVPDIPDTGSLRDDLRDRNVRSVAAIAHVGSVVSYQGGRVGLLGHVRPAPAGHVYEAWVIPPGQNPLAAGTFPGGRIALTLTRPAAPGDRIVVTLEPGHGGSAPKGPAVGQATLA